MKVILSLILLSMSTLTSCSNAEPKDNNALVFLKKTGILTNFKNAIEQFNVEKIATHVGSNHSENFLNYQKKYNDQEIENRLESFVKQSYSEEELEKLIDLDSDKIYEYNKAKFKEMEDKVEKLYDEVYLEGNKLLSGIQIIGTPNQSKPFEFFSIERPNGLYIANSYDSYMPQHIQVQQKALISTSNFQAIKVKQNALEITLPLVDQEIISNHLQSQSNTPIVLIIKKRIISVISDNSTLQNNVLNINSPWSNQDLEEFTKVINKEIKDSK